MDVQTFGHGLLCLTGAVGTVLLATLCHRTDAPRLLTLTLLATAVWLVLHAIQTLVPVSSALTALLR